jgi:hypothetical protein
LLFLLNDAIKAREKLPGFLRDLAAKIESGKTLRINAGDKERQPNGLC